MVAPGWRGAVGVVDVPGAAVQPRLQHLRPALGLLHLVLLDSVLRPLAVLGQALGPHGQPVLHLVLLLLPVLNVGVIDDVVSQGGEVGTGDGTVDAAVVRVAAGTAAQRFDLDLGFQIVSLWTCGGV